MGKNRRVYPSDTLVYTVSYTPCPYFLLSDSPTRAQGDLSLDHYDDSQHSRGSFNLSGGIGGIGALGISNGSLPIRASSGFPRENSGGVSSSSAAPWGSGMGKAGDAGGLGGQHSVVPGGIWLPTPRTQGTSSFSPSSSTGAAGGGGGGGGGAAGGAGGGGGGAGRERAGDRGESGISAANGGFFGSGNGEPRCARCSNTDAVGQAQVGGRACVYERVVLSGNGRDCRTKGPNLM